MAPHATYRNASNGSNDINEHAFVRDSGVDLPPPFPPQWQPKPFAIEKHSLDQTRRLRVIVIGAGLTGILAGILLPAKLDNLDLTILEKNADVVSACALQ